MNTKNNKNIPSKIYIIGDVHGKFREYKKLCDSFPEDSISLQLGDMGVFRQGDLPVMDRHYFFRGNHDNPSVCRAHSKYAVEYGMWNGLYIVAGADSIDKKWLTSGVNWWPDEQLDRETMELALEDYIKTKPDILVCHEAPFKLHQIAKAASCTYDRNNESWGEPRGNSTAFLLDSMIQAHMPKMLVHGHWHNPLIYKQWGCVFISLGELEALDLEAALAYYKIKLS
jgi:predicted phosphodiesterase